MIHFYQKIMNEHAALEKINTWQGKKIVFTNGCFDILHLGHVEYLNQAKNLGDKLIVGMNSDDSIKNIKGINRPIHTAKARTKIMASLQAVDMVIIFNEDTPERLIQKITPQILVKGDDYQNIQTIIGAKWVLKHGGIVKTLPFVDGFSTTKIIQKIQAQNKSIPLKQ